MTLVLKGDVLFLHIPKTGGSWVREVLAGQGLVIGRIGHKHADFSHVRVPRPFRSPANWLGDQIRLVRLLSDRPRIFCVVRHPLAWYESWFRYQSDRGWKDWGTPGHLRRWHVCAELNGIAHDDFAGFMRAVNRSHPGFVSAMYARYAGQSGARVLHQERLAGELAALLAEWGLAADPAAIEAAAPVNVSAAHPVAWDPETLSETVLNERAGLIRYGYLDDALMPAGLPVTAGRIREILGRA